jgi:hypothetical protein
VRQRGKEILYEIERERERERQRERVALIKVIRQFVSQRDLDV